MTNTRIPQTITTQADMDAVLSVPDTYTLTPGTRVTVSLPIIGVVSGHVVDHFTGELSGDPMIHVQVGGMCLDAYLTDIVVTSTQTINPASALPAHVRLIPTAFESLVNVALHGKEFGHVNTRDGVSDAYIWDGEDGDIHVHTGTLADCLQALVHKFTHLAV